MWLIETCRRLRDEAQDLHEERLALLAVGADAGHLMRQPQQLEALLAPLRAAWDGELVVRRALDDMLADNKKWIQVRQADVFRRYVGPC